MANLDFPRGFSLLDGEHYLMKTYYVTTVDARTIAPGDLVSQINTGYVQKSAAGDDAVLIGVVVACYSTTGAALRYLPASTAGSVLVACALPDTIFTVQDDASAALGFAEIGITTDHLDGEVNTFTGRSIQEIKATPAGGTNLRIIGKVDAPNNAYGVNCLWKVTFCQSIWLSATSV